MADDQLPTESRRRDAPRQRRPMVPVFVDLLTSDDLNRLEHEHLSEYVETVDDDEHVPGRALALIGEWGVANPVEDAVFRAYGVMSRRRNIHTLHRKVEYRVTNISWFAAGAELPMKTVLDQLKRSQGDHIVKALANRGGLPDRSELNFLTSVRDARPEIEATISTVVDPPGIRDIPPDLLAQRAEEKDAIATAFEIAGLDRLMLAPLLPTPGTSLVDSMIQQQNNWERDLLSVDMRRFDGYRGHDGNIANSIVFEHPEIGRLTVVNVDGRPLETALGVDLIYYRHETSSFILVQYKRMKRGPSGWVYTGDKKFTKQLAAMRSIEVVDDFSTPWDFRLEPNPCYFKLIRGADYLPGSADLIKGVHLSLPLVESLLATDQYVTSEGHLRVGIDTSANRRRDNTFQPPYFSNTELMTLFRGGWIGSTGTTSARIMDIIRDRAGRGQSVLAAFQDRRVASLRPDRRSSVGRRR